MSNCNLNKIIADKVGIQKFTKYDEVDFNIAQDIDACVKVNAKKGTVATGANAAYSQRAIPSDMFNTCEGFGCKNTGTLYVGTKETAGTDGNYDHEVEVTYKALADAREFSAGVFVFYADLGSTFDGTVTTKFYSIGDKTNADVYETKVSRTGAKESYVPIVVDLANLTSTTEGTGWVANSDGVMISIDIKTTDKEQGSKTYGISSLAFFEDISDLESNVSIKMSCLSSVDGDDTVDPLDTTCTRDGYDDTSVSVERTIEGTLLTANGLMLDPLIAKGNKTEGFRMRTIEVTVEDAKDGAHGKVTISDHYVEECGFVYAAISDQCNITDSVLTRINSPELMTLDDTQFQVVNSKANPTMEDVDGSIVYFDSTLIGKTVKVSYPATVDVTTHYVASAKNLEGKRASVTYTKKMTDGTAHIYHYKRAFITSFPHGIPDDGSMSVSLQFKEDTQGNLYELSVVNSENAYL